MPKKSKIKRGKSNTLDFLNEKSVELRERGLLINNYAVSLIFLAFVGAIIASVLMKSHWPFTVVGGALGIRSILSAFLKR